jgi:hypothetical protein
VNERSIAAKRESLPGFLSSQARTSAPARANFTAPPKLTGSDIAQNKGSMSILPGYGNDKWRGADPDRIVDFETHLIFNNDTGQTEVFNSRESAVDQAEHYNEVYGAVINVFDSNRYQMTLDGTKPVFVLMQADVRTADVETPPQFDLVEHVW